MKKLAFWILGVGILLMAACSAEAKGEIKKIGDTDAEAFAKLAGTQVGNNSEVIGIVQALPGAETMKELDLRGEKVKVSYGAKKGSLPQEEIFAFWFDENDAMEKNFFYNAVYLTLLIPNSKKYILSIEDFSFRIQREEMLAALAERFPAFPTSEAAEDEKAMAEFIRTHEAEIVEWTSADISRNKFFLSHPIAYTSR
jgi:hypothetical protein